MVCLAGSYGDPIPDILDHTYNNVIRRYPANPEDLLQPDS